MKKRSEIRVLTWIGILVGFFVIAAGLIQYFESAHSESSIRTYSQALWYSLVTISTVGYGDYYPVSSGGQFIGSLVIVFSLGFAGFIIGKIQSSVSENIRRKYLGMKGCAFTGHYIVFGWNNNSRIVVHELLKADKRIAVLASTESQLTEIDNVFHKKREFVFKTFGPFESEEIYERLNMDTAASIILVCDDDTSTLITALNLRKRYPKAQIIAHIANPALKETIATAGVTYVVSSNEIVGRMIASAAFEPDVSRVLEDLLSGTEGEDEYDIQQYKLTPASKLLGKTVLEAEAELHECHAGRLLAVVGIQPDGTRQIDKNPRTDKILVEGEYLVLIVNGKEAKELKGHIMRTAQGVGE